jgi:Cu-Zn family superoxide dismutase
MSSASSSTRVIASLAVVAVVAGVLAFATNVFGQDTSACLEKNTAVAKLKDVEGNKKGRVIFGVDSTCTTKVTAHLRGVPEGFHGFHVHTTGVCDAGAAFAGAGSHWNKAETDHGNHTGDMPPVMGMETGAAEIAFLTDRYQAGQLVKGDGTAVILHAAPDNLAHIPSTTTGGAERYHSHAYDTAGADQDSRATGDAGTRYACGVVEKLDN